MANKINRRDFLKTGLAGAGLMVGSALLAGKWNKPVMAAGGLPAHAKASGDATATPGPTETPAAACNPSDFIAYAELRTGNKFGIGYIVPVEWVGQTVDWVMDAAPTVDNGATFSGGTPALSGTETIELKSGVGFFQVWHLGSLPDYDEVTVSTAITKTSFNIAITKEGQQVCNLTPTDVAVTVP